MRGKNLQILLFCVTYYLVNYTKAQIAKCDYSYQYHWTTLYRTTNASYYKCDMSTENDQKITRIDGQHGTGRSDTDVKFISNFKDNKIKTFSSIFCQKFSNLEAIQLGYADLESIDENSLINCKNLDHLLLYGNKHREIPEKLLTGNSKLTILWILNSQLANVPEKLFQNQKELKELNLGENQISFMGSSIFRPLLKLEVLQLYRNKLTSINPEWFENLPNLKWLGLNENQISEIPSKCFGKLENLEKLWLYENSIKTLNSGSFDGLHNLQLLSLQSNDISDLPANVLTQLRNLRDFYMSNNKLTAIHSDSFGVHNMLTYVYLQDNRINAVDPKFIDNTAVSALNMTNNICSQSFTRTKGETKLSLKKCFENYQPRFRHQPQVNQLINNKGTAPNVNICGKSTAGHGNIVGGSRIIPGSFPWLAALMYLSNEYFCGGTLISSQKVLTAAHCIQEKQTYKATTASEFVVLLGAHDLKMTLDVGRINRAVESVNVHPNLNILTESYDADIAVLVLENEVPFNKYIQPICMPNENIASINVGVVVGYGRSEDTTKVHENIPKMIETPIHDNTDCFLSNYLLAKLSSRRTFCGGTGIGIGVCRGDSGGGLIVNDGSAYYLRGIVSSSLIGGPFGCDLDTYSVFTDVTKYIDWIDGISTSRFK